MVEKIFCDAYGCGKELTYRGGYYIIEIKANQAIQSSGNMAIISMPTKKQVCKECLEKFLKDGA